MNQRIAQTIARHLADLSTGADRPDAELLGRFVADRDGAAFAVLVRRHGPMVWAACRHLLPNSADAEDAFQATFLALAKSAHRVQSAAAVGGWLHGVAVRAALKVRRSETQRKRWERAAAGPESGRPVPDSAWDGLLAAVHEEVGRLPDALRTAFVLCDLEGVPQPTAAARLGWKPGTLTGRLARARQRLLDQLTKRGLAPAVAAGGIGTATTGAAVPPGLNQTVLAWVADPTGVPAAVSVLVAEVTAMTVSKMKLLAAGLMVAGGLGLGVGAGRVATVTAQVPADAPKPAVKAEPTPPAAVAPLAKPAESTWEFKYVVPPTGVLSSLGEVGGIAERHAADRWELCGVVPRSQVAAEDRPRIDGLTPEVLARVDGLKTDGGGRIDVLVFKRRSAAAVAAGVAAAVEPMAAIAFRQLVQLSGGTGVVRFDNIQPQFRDLLAGAFPPLPTTGTMDQAEFTKWFLDWAKTRAEPRRLSAPNSPLAAKPSVGVDAYEGQVLFRRLTKLAGGTDVLQFADIPKDEREWFNRRAEGRNFPKLPSTGSMTEPDFIKWFLDGTLTQAQQRQPGAVTPGRRPAAEAASPAPLPAFTTDEDLKLARAQQKSSAERLAKYKETVAIIESQFKKGIATSLEVAGVRDGLFQRELAAEEAAIRVAAAERRAAEAATPAPKAAAAEPKPAQSSAFTAAEDLTLARVQQKMAAVRLEEAKSRFEYTESLVKQKVVSQTELASARSTLRLAELQVEEAAIRLEAAERRAAEAGKPTPAPMAPAAEPKR